MEGLGVGIQDLSAEDDFAKQMAAMVQQVWKDKGMPSGLINKEVTSEFAKRLWGGVKDGYGNAANKFDAGKIDYDSPDDKMLRALQKNVWQFSAAKNYTQLRELSNALIGDDKKLRTFNQFKEAALKINEEYIHKGLRAEYNLAVAGGQMAGKWVDIQNNAATLPYLEFDAVMDGRTTDICRPLNGVLLPINHSFWQTYYPPNHWGCRSTVRQRASGKVTPEHEIPNADLKPMFQTNMATSGLVFPSAHPFFKDIPKDVLIETLKTMPYDAQFKPLSENRNIRQHFLVNQNAKDYALHKEISIEKAAKGHRVDIMPTLNEKESDLRSILFPDAKEKKSPDLRIDGLLTEVKQPEKPLHKSKISHSINSAAKQAEHVIIQLDSNFNKGKQRNLAKSSFNVIRSLKTVSYRYKGKYKIFTREMFY